MSRIAGIKFHKNNKGDIESITVNLKKWGNELEDFLDRLKIQRYKNEPTVAWTDLKNKLDKKFEANVSNSSSKTRR